VGHALILRAGIEGLIPFVQEQGRKDPLQKGLKSKDGEVNCPTA